MRPRSADPTPSRKSCRVWKPDLFNLKDKRIIPKTRSSLLLIFYADDLTVDTDDNSSHIELLLLERGGLAGILGVWRDVSSDFPVKSSDGLATYIRNEDI